MRLMVAIARLLGAGEKQRVCHEPRRRGLLRTRRGEGRSPRPSRRKSGKKIPNAAIRMSRGVFGFGFRARSQFPIGIGFFAARAAAGVFPVSRLNTRVK